MRGGVAASAVLTLLVLAGCGEPTADADCPDGCFTPPPPVCDGTRLVSFAVLGECSDGMCVYPPTITECADGCSNGACEVIERPCDDVVCDDPPVAECDGETLVQYAQVGACIEESGVCDYAAVRVECAARGQLCRDGACVAPGLCEGVTCEDPPAPFCRGNRVVTTVSTGCNPDDGVCGTEEQTVDCSASDAECVEGACVPIDRCTGVICQTPPEDSCDADVRVVWTAEGTCNNADGSCAYESTRTPCGAGETCLLGRCLGADHCSVAGCDAPTRTECDGDVAVSVGTPGSCDAESGVCAFPETRTDCAAEGLRCVAGGCVAPPRCEGVVCDSPPPAECFGDAALVPVAAGTCDESTGDCSYDVDTIDCAATGLICRDGACVPDPCDDIVCDAPPEPTCDFAVAIAYTESGLCDDGACSYLPRTEDCGALGLDCSAGTCVPRNPCAGVSCETPPPPLCEGNVALSYSGAGVCIDGACQFSPRQRDCDGLGLICDDGACVEPGACTGVDCSVPPPPTCEGDVAIALLPPGICADGTCEFSESRTDCASSGRLCVAGACQLPDLCGEVGCIDPPQDRCSGETAVTYSAGECVVETGLCDYPADFTDCAASGQRCLLGACVEDLCEGVACEAAPDDTCDGDLALRYAAIGECNPIDGECGYDVLFVDCSAFGDTCLAGQCIGRCATVTCEPPPAVCDGNVAVSTNDGECVEGDCFFDELREDCSLTGRVCAGGACVANPCEGVSCDQVPVPACEDDVLVSSASPGLCLDGTCRWVETVRDCAAEGLACIEGACRDACTAVRCDSPPAPACDGAVVSTWRSPGTCAAGDCSYVEERIACDVVGRVCVDGACVPSPCEGVVCDDPPAAFCRDNVRVSSSGVGVCTDGDCGYAVLEQDCTATGAVCFEGRCVGACDAVVCDEPPAASCLGAVALRYNATGDCDGGTCDYGEMATDCAAAGLVCVDGACVEGPCSGVACDNPPDAVCDGETRIAFVEPGACLNGDCRYTELREDCAELGKLCVDGACVDLCDGIECLSPPADFCEGALAVAHDTPGACFEGDCSYATTRTDCAAAGLSCRDGACVAGPCDGVLCDEPPAPACDGVVAVVSAAIGACLDGDCFYDQIRTDCPARGEICVGGACVDACTGVACDDPPPGSCEGSVATAFSATGVCSSGVCTFEQSQTDCSLVGQVCDRGACVPGPCDGVVCDDALPPLCEGDELVVFGRIGTCAGGGCVYPETRQDCSIGGGRCEAGRCLGPCDEVVCDTPPAGGCVGDLAFAYDEGGTCSDGTCNYAEQVTDCAAAGQICQAGACVDGPCDGVVCDVAPAPFCEDTLRVAFVSPGTCAGGICAFGSTSFDCDALDEDCVDGLCRSRCTGVACNAPPPGLCEGSTAVAYSETGVCTAGNCSYDELRTNCAAVGMACDAGRCVEDPCLGVFCDEAPAPVCLGSISVIAVAPGLCSEGACAFDEVRVDCSATGERCEGGVCVDACIGVECNEPPASTCEGVVAVAWSPIGFCALGDCSYTELRTNCSAVGQVCSAGACVPGPCEGVACLSPPAATCEGGVRVDYAAVGSCDGGTCSYGEFRQDCGSFGLICEGGACVGPCDGISCVAPPPDVCDGQVAVIHPPVGECDGGNCSYASDRVDCAVAGLVCVDGACVLGPCEGLFCDEPPAPRCDGDDRVVSASLGACLAGDCVYDETREDCAAIGYVCDGGECRNPCASVVCDAPPAGFCDGAVAVSAEPAGVCSAGVCSYSELRTNCTAAGLVCDAGRCVDGPCAGIACDAPPADTCLGDIAIVHEPVGICADGTCDYANTPQDCTLDDRVCFDGECVDACLFVECTQPPATCDGDVSTVFVNGGCVAGECLWTPQVEDCGAAGGICVNGLCEGTDLCDGVSCVVAPNPVCSGDTAVAFIDPGVCRLGECVFEQTEDNCASRGEICVEGICQVDPCADVTCDTIPENQCVGTLAIRYSGAGRCNEVGTCVFDAVRDDCSIGGRTCEAGVCVGGGSCDGVVCDEPPASACSGGFFVSYAAPGACIAGECLYEPETVDCTGLGQQCTPGGCEPLATCEGVVCDTPPPPTCVDGAAVTYSLPGQCELGECLFQAVRDDCAARGATCVDGACEGGGDLCADVECPAPSPVCAQNDVVIFADGICNPFTGFCDYGDLETILQCETLLCVNGVCVDVPLQAGDVVVNEFLVDPVGSGASPWIEVLNQSGRIVELRGLSLSDGVSTTEVEAGDPPLRVRDGATAVLAEANDPSLGAQWIWGDRLNFGRTAGTIEILAGDLVLDRVAYAIPSWPILAGFAAALDPDRIGERAAPDAWCPGTTVYDGTNHGTPGADNFACE